MAQYPLDDFKEIQWQNAELGPIIWWPVAEVDPTVADLMLQSPSTWHMWLYHKQDHGQKKPVVGDARLT